MSIRLSLVHLIPLALAGAALMALSASPRSRKDEPPGVVLARVPDKARQKQNPLENDPAAPAAGKKLFALHCAECHGEAGAGSNRGPSLLTDDVAQATAGTLFWIVTNGVVRHGMPDWSKLPEPQRWQIVTFLQGLRAESENPYPER